MFDCICATSALHLGFSGSVFVPVSLTACNCVLYLFFFAASVSASASASASASERASASISVPVYPLAGRCFSLELQFILLITITFSLFSDGHVTVASGQHCLDGKLLSAVSGNEEVLQQNKQKLIKFHNTFCSKRGGVKESIYNELMRYTLQATS